MAINAVLTREHFQDKQVTGTLQILENGAEIYKCKTLELPWLNNQRNISCIPEGEYQVKKRSGAESSKFKYEHFHVLDVPNRTWILWHAGNYHTQIQGCILMGQKLTDINADGYADVISSKVTINKLVEILPQKFSFTIKS